MDACKKWEAENKANKAVAKVPESEVNFFDNSVELSSSVKATLDKVAVILVSVDGDCRRSTHGCVYRQ